ncbi:hypothetical protein ABZX12_40970 [Kribbella sp. NPDC003505]|uniref:hypothetical protein n=1 Tax=Kribbella sp. NPDC003505 TaxID=3154448 RepID=UPI0033AD6FD2
MAEADVLDLLGRLHSAVASRLGIEDAAPPRHRFATWGRTRVRRDGSLQIWRRDATALSIVVRQGAGAMDTASRARAVAAFGNVTAACVQQLTNPDGARQAHFRVSVAKELAQDELGAAAGGGLAAAAVVSVPPAVTVWVSPSWPLIAGTAGAAVAAAPVASAWLSARRSDVLGGGIDRAWVRAQFDSMGDELGVADVVAWRDDQGGRRADPSLRTAQEICVRLGQYTGLDARDVLGHVVRRLPDERAGAMVDLLRGT